jgi:hypothetical protein
MTCPGFKHIIHPACFENQNLTNTKDEYEIEKVKQQMQGIPAWCTLTGFILAMDKKKSNTTCSPPWKQKD